MTYQNLGGEVRIVLHEWEMYINGSNKIYLIKNFNTTLW